MHSEMNTFGIRVILKKVILPQFLLTEYVLDLFPTLSKSCLHVQHTQSNHQNLKEK